RRAGHARRLLRRLGRRGARTDDGRATGFPRPPPRDRARRRARPEPAERRPRPQPARVDRLLPRRPRAGRGATTARLRAGGGSARRTAGADHGATRAAGGGAGPLGAGDVRAGGRRDRGGGPLVARARGAPAASVVGGRGRRGAAVPARRPAPDALPGSRAGGDRPRAQRPRRRPARRPRRARRPLTPSALAPWAVEGRPADQDARANRRAAAPARLAGPVV